MNQSPRAKFISENESGMILNGVELQLDGSKGDLASRPKMKQSPAGQANPYTESSGLHSRKKASVGPSPPQFLNTKAATVTDQLHKANKGDGPQRSRAGVTINQDINVSNVRIDQ